MCGVIGGIKLKAPIEQSYYESCKTELSADIIFQLLISSGNRGHESVGLEIEGIEGQVSNFKQIGTVSKFLSDKGSAIKNHIEHSGINSFLGHVRYATDSGKKREGKGTGTENIHPLLLTSKNFSLTLIENGQTCFKNISKVLEDGSKNFNINRYGATSDTSDKGRLLLKYLEQSNAGFKADFNSHLSTSLTSLYGTIFDNGMFSTLGVIKNNNTDESRFFVMRDGGRPLFYFDLDGYRIFTSETSPINDLKQKLSIDLKPKNIHEFIPGTFQIYDVAQGIQTSTSLKMEKKPFCFFEYLYMMAPNAHVYDISGNRVNIEDLRAALGLQTCLEHLDIINPARNNEDYIICPVPRSADFFVRRLSEELDLTVSYDTILRNNTDRTFIASDDAASRAQKADDKFTVTSNLEGKIVIVFDDSLVRYNVAAVVNKKLRAMGVKEVYYLFGCPPITSPCFGGINTYRKDLAVTLIEKMYELSAVDIANDYFGTKEHAEFEELLKYFDHEDAGLKKFYGGPIETDGIGFLSNAGLNKVLNAFNLPPTAQCCVTDKYPYRFDGISNHKYISSRAYAEKAQSRVIA